jgi:hypothetical protein
MENLQSLLFGEKNGSLGQEPSAEGRTKIGYDFTLSSLFWICALNTSSSDLKAAR